MGRVDLRELRSHIGHVTTGQRLLDEEDATALTVVLTGATGTVLPLWERYDHRVRERAMSCLDLMGCSYLAQRPIRVCSQGERARVRIARALVAEPELLLLDEPCAGLDLPGREDLLEALEALMRLRPASATVVVTHHLEEIPSTITHAVLLREGTVTGQGPIASSLTDTALSRCFGRPLQVHRLGGRWTAHAA